MSTKGKNEKKKTGREEAKVPKRKRSPGRRPRNGVDPELADVRQADRIFDSGFDAEDFGMVASGGDGDRPSGDDGPHGEAFNVFGSVHSAESEGGFADLDLDSTSRYDGVDVSRSLCGGYLYGSRTPSGLRGRRQENVHPRRSSS